VSPNRHDPKDRQPAGLLSVFRICAGQPDQLRERSVL